MNLNNSTINKNMSKIQHTLQTKNNHQIKTSLATT